MAPVGYGVVDAGSDVDVVVDVSEPGVLDVVEVVDDVDLDVDGREVDGFDVGFGREEVAVRAVVVVDRDDGAGAVVVIVGRVVDDVVRGTVVRDGLGNVAFGGRGAGRTRR